MSTEIPRQPDDLWALANRRMIAKAIGELCYEQALVAQPEDGERYRLPLQGKVQYRFQAQRSIWDFLLVAPDSVQRIGHERTQPADDAGQFFIDAAKDIGLSDVVLGGFLHEMANTLAADVALLRARAGLSADALAQMPDDRLQALLDGHPKGLVNKGRIGWGAREFEAYGTEAQQPVQWLWLAVDRDAVRGGFGAGWTPERLLREALSPPELDRFLTHWSTVGLSRDRYLPLPIHPWQWDQHVRQHFAGDIVQGRIVPLGLYGDGFLPQQSLRTFSNATRPAALHIKLPLTVLNTSCYRGIPGQYIEIGPALSEWLGQRCEDDPVLSARHTRALSEVAGIHYPHPHHEQIAGTPYRYREMLGAIWRQSPYDGLAPDERPILLAALLQRDDAGRSVIGALIRRSGLGTEAWLEALFERVLVPLYHLQCRYGIGLVAHAQNLCLILRNDAPAAVALKDLQGDLRLVDRDFPECGSLPQSVRDTLPRLPAEYLIHDLLTGHFVTALRFISAALWQADGFPEPRFYALAAQVLRRYQASQPELQARFALFDLFRPQIERVCVNRVRFKIGYDDSAERPLPMLGGMLDNPLRWGDASHPAPTDEPVQSPA